MRPAPRNGEILARDRTLSLDKALLGWPFVGMPLMVLLGHSVRDGATPVDGWFQRGTGGALNSLVLLTDAGTAKTMLAAAVVVAVARRLWALVPMIIGVPLVAVLATEVLKPWFGRMKGTDLAYPSGHTTVMIVVIGMLVLAVGVRRWVLLAAAVFAVLGIVGQSVTYHYFTDAMGSVLLGSSLVCLTAGLMRRLRL
ncbi:MAG: PA-phosphatase [Mycobacterium sp.]